MKKQSHAQPPNEIAKFYKKGIDLNLDLWLLLTVKNVQVVEDASIFVHQ